MVKLSKTLAKFGLASAGFAALSFAAAGTASASCASGSLYCNANSWTSAGTSYASAPATYNYGSTSSYTTSSSYGQSSDYSYSSASAAPAGMTRVPCPYTVDVPEGGRVLDCYAIAKPAPAPAPVTTYRPVYNTVQSAYQVVRPVVYVDYPVPVAVPNACGPIYSPDSRYGDYYGGYSRGGCR